MKREVMWRPALVGLAIVALAITVALHSLVQAPDIFDDTGLRRLPASADIYLDGELLKSGATLPLRRNDLGAGVVEVVADVSGLVRPGESFAISTDADKCEVWADGELLLAYGTGSDGRSMTTGPRNIVFGSFPVDRETGRLRMVFRPGAAPTSWVYTVHTLLVGDYFSIISYMRAPLTIYVLLGVLDLTILLGCVAVLLIGRGSWNNRKTASFLLAEFAMTAISLSSNPLRSVLLPNEEMWQALRVFCHAMWPPVALWITVEVGKSRRHATRAWVSAACAPALLIILSAVARPFGHAAADDILSKAPLVSTAFTLALGIAITISHRKTGAPKLHFATLVLITALSFLLDSVPASHLYSALLASTLASVGRSVAVLVFLILAITEFVARENIAAGQSELDDLLYKDALTGCYNRRSFDELSNDDGLLSSESFLVMVHDMNGVKAVNDSFGHTEGDRIIAAYGAFLAQVLPEGSKAYRSGGDEFVTVTPAKAAPDPGALAETMAGDFASASPYEATVSIGWALHDRGGKAGFAKAMEEADAMMYEGKREWRGRREDTSPTPTQG